MYDYVGIIVVVVFIGGYVVGDVFFVYVGID